jgi:hypothetical protein
VPIQRKRTSRLQNREVLCGRSLVDWVAVVDLLGAEPGEEHAVDRQQAVESLVLLGVVLDRVHDRAHLVAAARRRGGQSRGAERPEALGCRHAKN